MIGSKHSFFSLTQATPLIGFFGSVQSITLVYLVRILIHAMSLGLSLATFLYYVPTFLATVYLSNRSSLAKALLVATSMVLFILHPVGWQVSWYTLYWFLPLIMAFVSTRSIFLRSLSATLVNHAFGTVVWLYSGLLSTQQIYQIATIAWLERIMIALMLTLGYYAITSLLKLAEKGQIKLTQSLLYGKLA